MDSSLLRKLRYGTSTDVLEMLSLCLDSVMVHSCILSTHIYRVISVLKTMSMNMEVSMLRDFTV